MPNYTRGGRWSVGPIERETCVSVSGPEGWLGVARAFGDTLEEALGNAELIALAPELDGYRQYVEDHLEDIERGGWTPVCFEEFRQSEWCAIFLGEEAE